MELDENIFKPLSKLETLHLGENRITSFPEALFSPLIQLETLIIYFNPIKSASAHLLEKNQKLNLIQVDEKLFKKEFIQIVLKTGSVTVQQMAPSELALKKKFERKKKEILDLRTENNTVKQELRTKKEEIHEILVENKALKERLDQLEAQLTLKNPGILPKLSTKDIENRFYQTVPKSVVISRIELVSNDCLSKRFELTLQIMSQQGHDKESSPFNQRFEKTPEKLAVLDRLSQHYQRVSQNDKIKIVPTWVGVSRTKLEALCKAGFADLRQLDKGYFGAGIYSTLQADYARIYAEGLVGGSPLPPTAEGEHCLLFCWIAVGNVYPISRDIDYNPGNHFSDFFHKDNGLALKPGFDSHCACVFLDEKKMLQAAKYDLVKEHFEPHLEHLVDEIVVKESAQILPYGIVYYKKPIDQSQQPTPNKPILTPEEKMLENM